MYPAPHDPSGVPSAKAEPVVIEVGDDVEILPPEHSADPADVPDLDEDAASHHLPARKARTDLVPFDALNAYLREIAQYKPLSKEREHELALRYVDSKDRAAAYELVTSNLILVVKIARDYERAARNLLDLIQEGNIGLMEAVRNFDPFRGVRFPSYAIWWIKAYIIRYIMANWRLVKIGTTQAQRKLFFNLKKEKDKLEREGFYPAPKLLAQNLQVRESDIVEMEQRLGQPDASVDAPLHSDADSTLLSVLPSPAINAEEALARKEVGKLLADGLDQFASTLNTKERLIFKERMLNEEKVTLNELADSLDLSIERVRQLESRIREKLRAFLTGKFGATLESLVSEPSDS